jgi:hypothetical protein
MFNMTPITYYIIISFILVLFINYCYNNEHFSTVNKRKRRVKRRNMHHVKPKRHIIPTRIRNKPPVITPMQINKKDEKEYRKKYHYDYRYPNYYHYNYTCPNYWYEYLYPTNWSRWFGYATYNEPVLPAYDFHYTINLADNCHKKCIDRYDNETNTRDYLNKIDNCIDEFCY